MATRAEQIRAFILQNVEQHPKDIVAVTADRFKVTRTTVHRHIASLRKQEKLYMSGTTNTATYSLPGSFSKRLSFEITPQLSESDVWLKNFGSLKNELPQNVYDICQYGFTEILNNAIDHSEGEHVHIETDRKEEKFSIRISDDGIGIFRKIKEAFGLKDERESILQLSKGKLTTDPKRHSGEGIFFSSRAFDSFCIAANGFTYFRDNQEDDWFVEKQARKMESSTLVRMLINVHSPRDLNAVFTQYVDPETNAFNKTHILVNLSLSNEDRFVSRSQAKRILFGLEKFKYIILDFKDIKAVGQAFVDEVFRVFKNAHPHVKIDVINQNEEIKFMIDRGVSTAAEKNLITPTMKKNDT